MPVNFTSFSAIINQGFEETGDFARGKSIKHLAEVLDRGIKVALVYGDRDFSCIHPHPSPSHQ